MLKKLAIILVVTFGVLWGLDRAAAYFYVRHVNNKVPYATLRPINADLLIAGPCEPESMVDPEVMDSIIGLASYNSATNHSDFADNYLNLYLYLKHQKKPKAIFLYVTPESFDSKIANVFNTYRYITFLDDPVVRNVVQDMDPDYLRVSKVPFMRFAYYSHFTLFSIFSGAGNTLRNQSRPDKPNGYYAPFDGFAHPIHSFRDLNPHTGYYSWDPKREKYFRKFIEYSRSQGIPLVLYESPIIAEAIPYEKNRPEFIRKIRSIADAYHTPFWCFDTLAIAKDKSLYFSTLSTNARGSAIFSDFFGRYIAAHLPCEK